MHRLEHALVDSVTLPLHHHQRHPARGDGMLGYPKGAPYAAPLG